MRPLLGSFIAFWLCAARVVAGMNVHVWDATEPIERSIRSQQPLDLSALADPDARLDGLLPRVDPA